MSAAAPMAYAEFLPLLPEGSVGGGGRLEPIRVGLSGAAVFLVTATRGQYVLRVQGKESDECYFGQQVKLLRRVAKAGIAPAVVHVDEGARAVVWELVAGPPLHPALADP